MRIPRNCLFLNTKEKSKICETELCKGVMKGEVKEISMRSFIISSILGFFANLAYGSIGITKDTIKIGIVNAVSGPAKDLGEGIRKGIQAYIGS